MISNTAPFELKQDERYHSRLGRSDDRLKIVLVGAGSREFGPASINDVLLSDALCAQDLDLVLMDVSAKTLPEHQAYAEKVARQFHRTLKISHTTDLDEALDGADYVITAIEIRRYFYWAQDFHIPRKYGFRQIYGENGGPGGLFHALRNMGPSLKIAKAMERNCPDAILLNYTNPLTKLSEAFNRLSKVKMIGLCHGVFYGKKQLCQLLEMEMNELDAYATGLNHITWFQSIRHKQTGEDLYPLLKEKERAAHWLADWDDIALSRTLMRVFGMYPSPGANHVGEYIRWAEEFLGSSALQFFYDPAEGHPWETGKTPTWIYNLNDHPTDTSLFAGAEAGTMVASRTEQKKEELKEPCPSGELAIPIIEGLFCGIEHELAAINISNAGYLPGFERDTIVEVPAVVNKNGLQPMVMDRLPEGILAMLRSQASINKLLVEAYEEQSRNKLLQAVLLDPTTNSYRQSVDLVNEMCKLQAEVLPPLHW